MVQKKPIHRNEKGQSAIEFILTFGFSLGFVFLFVNLTLNLTAGYLNHYVNFMASRTYLTADTGADTDIEGFAADRARDTFNQYPLKEFGVDADFEVINSEQGDTLYVGTTSTFRKPLSSMPIIGSSEKATLLSESFLGKEPSRNDCRIQVCSAIGSNIACDSPAAYTITVYDNGC